MEVRQATHDEMWFKVAGKHLKVSVEEFALASGLTCQGATSDEDVVRLGALYLISNFLYTTTSANVVPHEYFRIFESPYMDTFPWGNELFQITYIDDSRVFAAYLDKILFEVVEVEVVKVQPTNEEQMAACYKGLPQRERITMPSTLVAGADLVNDPVYQPKDHNHASSSNPQFMPCMHQAAQDTLELREPPIIPVLEHLMNEMLEIQDSQAQIMDSQNVLKVEVNRIERAMEINCTSLLTMFVRAKKHQSHDKDERDHIDDHSNEARTTNNKLDFYILSDLRHDECNPATSECLTAVIKEQIQNDVTNDINYTEEDLIQVDEVDDDETHMSRLHVSDEFGKDIIVQELFPNEKAHWILGHFNIKERALNVYNSSRLAVRDRMVVADIEAFAYILPCLMVINKNWQPNIVNVFERVEPLAVKIASDIP
ncbi:Hypothetical predicted protein [Olea europaea subsp. europaea]|uniref:DUF1985 domain-containing protein n=1 Tax=Olea europaea subsp. europaea TaxID=158383 RepID=A0A8S0QJG4_OLEEU|nr:Hypothetical predicted protein [Olea europaea subsp. europaea]